MRLALLTLLMPLSLSAPRMPLDQRARPATLAKRARLGHGQRCCRRWCSGGAAPHGLQGCGRRWRCGGTTSADRGSWRLDGCPRPGRGQHCGRKGGGARRPLGAHDRVCAASAANAEGLAAMAGAPPAPRTGMDGAARTAGAVRALGAPGSAAAASPADITSRVQRAQRTKRGSMHTADHTQAATVQLRNCELGNACGWRSWHGSCG